MPDVACGNCGRPLDEAASVAPSDRQPCPQCGSTARKFDVRLSGNLSVSGSLGVTASVTERLVGLRLEGHPPTVIVSAVGTASGSASTQGIGGAHIPSSAQLFPPSVSQVLPEVFVQATVVNVGEKGPDGSLVAGIAVPWFEIVRHLQKDPNFLYQIHWRQLEEIIAGAYVREGWSEVILTPRSGDGGRDIIASKPGLGSIRILDQIKAYRPGHLVNADEVRAMLGVLEAEQNVSKGFVTTTSTFAPGIETDSRLLRFMPYRLELKGGEQLLQWLTDLAETQ